MMKLLTRTPHVFLLITAFIGMTFFSGCGSDDSGGSGIIEEIIDDLDPTNDVIGYALFIEGPILVNVGDSKTYSAVLINTLGVESSPQVEWSFQNILGSGTIATVSNSGTLTTSNEGVGVLVAKYTIEGETIESVLPIDIFTPGHFVITPGAIIGSVGDDPLPLEATYLGINNGTAPNVTYQTDNSSVVTVTDSKLNFVGAGHAVITATATNIEGNPIQLVPVVVTGGINVPLPVTKVELSPKSATLFPKETLQFEAKAYNSEGAEVTDKEVTWELISLEEDLDGNPLEVGTITSGGLFTAVDYGQAQITAEVEGVRSAAGIIYVIPEFIINIDPFTSSLSPGASKQFNASVYAVDKETKLINDTPLENPPTISWELLDFGLDIFNIGTTDQTGKVTIKEDALEGFSSFLIAYATEESEKYYPGVSLISVGVAQECECGAKLENATQLIVEQDAFDISLISFDPDPQIIANVQDDEGVDIVDAQMSYCSGNELVVTVDSDGKLSAFGEGSAIVTVCHGELTAEITVNVTF